MTQRLAEFPTSLNPEASGRGLHAARCEAVPSAIMAGLTESFMIPYALALGATPLEAGLLSSARNLILSVVQLKSADAARWLRSRKRLVLSTAVLQAAVWIVLALVAVLFGSWAVAALIGFYTLGTASAAFGGPAWSSMVSEYLGEGQRGRFFGRLTLVAGAYGTVAALGAGGLLQLAAPRPVVGFGLLCGGAALSRAVSCYWLFRMEEGPLRERDDARFSFWAFLSQAPTSNFARFSLCFGAFGFAVHLAAPYLAVYMLDELHYQYMTYTGIVQAGAVATFLTAGRWGHVGDRSGNWVVLRWTMLGASIVPALWMVSRDPVWLLLVHVAGGCLWGGLNLSLVNFVYDAVTPAKRARCLAYFNAIHGCGVSLGALTGGWLLTWLPPMHSSSFAGVFYCSAVCRLLAAALFAFGVREIRSVTPVGLRHVVRDLVGQRVIQVLGLQAGEAGDGRRVLNENAHGRGAVRGD
jgi:MFS family permease